MLLSKRKIPAINGIYSGNIDYQKCQLLEIRTFTVKSAKESADGCDILLRSLLSEFETEHILDRILNACTGTIVEVRWGLRDIAKVRDLEPVKILILAGKSGEALVIIVVFNIWTALLTVREVVFENAHKFERLTAKGFARVAGSTAIVLKCVVSRKFLCCQSITIALKIKVEPVIRCEEGLLVFSDSIGHTGHGEAFSRIQRFKLLDQRSISAQTLYNLVPGLVAHFQRVLRRTGSLVGKGMRASVPELLDVEDGVEDGWGIDAAKLLIDAFAGAGTAWVGAAFLKDVAGGA